MLLKKGGDFGRVIRMTTKSLYYNFPQLRMQIPQHGNKQQKGKRMQVSTTKDNRHFSLDFRSRLWSWLSPFAYRSFVIITPTHNSRLPVVNRRRYQDSPSISFASFIYLTTTTVTVPPSSLSLFLPLSLLLLLLNLLALRLSMISDRRNDKTKIGSQEIQRSRSLRRNGPWLRALNCSSTALGRANQKKMRDKDKEIEYEERKSNKKDLSQKIS